MKKIAIVSLLFICLTSFTIHKFYFAIYQIKYAPEKQMLQITARIFNDDLNKALEKKYSQKTHIGDKMETAQDVSLMNKYLLEQMIIKVNGIQKPLLFVSKEMENNVVIGYYKITMIPKITTLEIKNTVMTELFPEQQNMIQTNFNGKKQSLLLTNENTSGVLK